MVNGSNESLHSDQQVLNLHSNNTVSSRNSKCIDKTLRNNRIYRPVQGDIWPEDHTHNLPVKWSNKNRQWADGAIKLKFKMAIVLLHKWKPSAKDKWYNIAVAELGKLSSIISWYAPKSEGILPEPKLGRNSSLQE